MGVKGRNSERGKGEIYDETKSELITISLTPTAHKLLKARVEEYCKANGIWISRNEYLERFVRGTL